MSVYIKIIWTLLIAGFVCASFPARAILIYDCSRLLFSKSQEQGPASESLGYKSENHFVVTADGIQLNSILIKTNMANSLGLVVQFHGQAGNSSLIWPEIRWLLDAGFDVFASEFREHNGSQGKVSLRAALKDVQAGLKYAEQLATKGNLPLVGVGHSLGGHLLYKAVSLENYPRLKVVLTEGTPAALAQTALDYASRLPWHLRILANFSSVLIPRQTDLAAGELSRLNGFLNIVVYAPDDEVVSPTQAHLLYSNLPEPKLRLENAPGEHAVGFSEGLRPKLVEILKKTLTP